MNLQRMFLRISDFGEYPPIISLFNRFKICSHYALKIQKKKIKHNETLPSLSIAITYLCLSTNSSILPFITYLAIYQNQSLANMKK